MCLNPRGSKTVSAPPPFPPLFYTKLLATPLAEFVYFRFNLRIGRDVNIYFNCSTRNWRTGEKIRVIQYTIVYDDTHKIKTKTVV